MSDYYADYPNLDEPTAELNDASCYDDRDEPGFDMDELDGFNNPMEKVAHL
jgi:hypothetical protein